MNGIQQPEQIGMRERKKRDRLQRIKSAARQLFIEKGYDETTVREIANRVDLSAATIFRYAQDKRDLLFLLFNDDHFDITTEAFSGIDEAAPLLDQLVDVFGHYYAYFAEQPMLARYVLREMEFYDSGEQAQKINKGRDNIFAGLSAIVSAARRDGTIRCTEDDAMIVQLIFDIYQAESRRWLLDDAPVYEDGLKVLRLALNLLINGLVKA